MLRAAGDVPGIRKLFQLSGANMQLTTDQPFASLFGGSAYVITHIVARQRSGAASVVCAGGIFDGAGKTGNILALVATSWVALASGVIVMVPIGSILTTALLTTTPILSLATGSTAACTADLTVLGFDFS